VKAYITSIGEHTTTLSFWSVKRLGFEPVLVRDKNTSLWDKLKLIYEDADEDFIRVDADVVCNGNILELIQQNKGLWYQSLTFGWFKQDTIHGGVQFVRKEAIPILRKHIDEAKNMERPETYMSRLEELHNPRTFLTFEKICGIHGYKQDDKVRIEETKKRRGVWGDYDWELASALEQL
jgi:hypothetical protein